MKRNELQQVIEILQATLVECAVAKLMCRTLANGIISTFSSDVQEKMKFEDEVETPKE